MKAIDYTININRGRPVIIILTLLALSGFVSVATAQTQIIYVNQQSGSNSNGTSWALACRDLQFALNAARNISGPKEIWVAKGEYLPGNLDRAISFDIPPQTKLFGGFAGSETTLTSRNPKKNRTILSGDIGGSGRSDDNSYHVVTAKDVDATSVLDGFIITKGNANGDPGVMQDSGAGMLVLSTVNGSTGPKIQNCEFVDNVATGFGGGLANVSNGNHIITQITNCYFNGNTASVGGGIANRQILGSNIPQITNCSFACNKANAFGGGIANVGSNAVIINNTICKNNATEQGGGVYNGNGSTAMIFNSILWKNYVGNLPSDYDQIHNSGSTPHVDNNLIQGGYPSGINIDQDPLFIKEPNPDRNPATSIIRLQDTPGTEKTLHFSGDPMPSGVYNVFNDHEYHKLYIVGRHLQIINTYGNSLGSSTLHTELIWGRISKMNRAVMGDLIFFGSTQSSLVSVNRATGGVTTMDLINDPSITYVWSKAEDVVVVGSLIYCPLTYSIAGERNNLHFYGLAEASPSGARRLITSDPTSVPRLPEITLVGEDTYWNGHRLYYDDATNILYYSFGGGVWWWNRSNNNTGIYSSSESMGLAPGNPGLPTTSTTSMYIDHSDNKFYIGTHAGLFVWDRNNNTSKVYNTINSKMIDNLVNQIDKVEGFNLIYVACEQGGVFVLNTKTGEQNLIKAGSGSAVNPQLVDTETESVYFDKYDKKMYVSPNLKKGAIWIQDFANLIADFGDLRLQDNSPAIDAADADDYPEDVDTDISGSDRFEDYPGLGEGDVGLDLGANEKPFTCPEMSVAISAQNNNNVFSFSPALQNTEYCDVSYNWNFGDGTTSNQAVATHTFLTEGPFSVSLEVNVTCGSCPPVTLTASKSVSPSANIICPNIECDGEGNVSLGNTTKFASGYRFSVGGKMQVEEVKVAWKAKWPDYVFEKNYHLMSLPDLKMYINSNRHLPGIPSADEVNKNGIAVEEVSMKLLEKVEELSLHFIRLDERLQKLENEKE
jgi:hypothetical protein